MSESDSTIDIASPFPGRQVLDGEEIIHGMYEIRRRLGNRLNFDPGQVAISITIFDEGAFDLVSMPADAYDTICGGSVQRRVYRNGMNITFCLVTGTKSPGTGGEG